MQGDQNKSYPKTYVSLENKKPGQVSNYTNYTKSVCLLDTPNLPKQEVKVQVEESSQKIVEQNKTETDIKIKKKEDHSSQGILPFLKENNKIIESPPKQEPNFGPKTLYETYTQFSITKKRSTLLRLLSAQKEETVRELLKNGNFTELWDLLMNSKHEWVPRKEDSRTTKERIHLDKLILEEVKTRELDPLLPKEESVRREYFRAIFAEAKRDPGNHTLSELELKSLKEKVTSSTEEEKAFDLESLVYIFQEKMSLEAQSRKDLIFYALINDFLSTESSESALLLSEMCSEGSIITRLSSPKLWETIVRLLVEKSTHLLKSHADQVRLVKERTESCSVYDSGFFKLLKVLRLEFGENSSATETIVKCILSLEAEELGLDPTKGQESEEQKKQLICGLLEGLPNEWSRIDYDAPTPTERIENKERSWQNLCGTLFTVDPEGKSGVLKLLFERAPFEAKKAALFKLFKEKEHLKNNVRFLLKKQASLVEIIKNLNLNPSQLDQKTVMEKKMAMERRNRDIILSQIKGNISLSRIDRTIKNLFNSLNPEERKSLLESCTQKQKDFLLPSHQE